MRSRSPANTVSATQCAAHPGSWWARPTVRYPASPEAACPAVPWFSGRRKAPSRPCPVRSRPVPGHVQPLPP